MLSLPAAMPTSHPQGMQAPLDPLVPLWSSTSLPRVQSLTAQEPQRSCETPTLKGHLCPWLDRHETNSQLP